MSEYFVYTVRSNETFSSATDGRYPVSDAKPLPVTGTVTSTSASVGATGSAVPASADYEGLNVAGNLRGQTGVNPSGTVYAAQVDMTSVGGTTVLTGGVAGSQGVGGLVATGAAISGAGNPVYVGGSDGTNVQPFKVSTGGVQLMAGDIASAATDSGNPVKIGGLVNTSTPTSATTGQRKDMWMGPQGQIVVACYRASVADAGATFQMLTQDGNVGALAVGGSTYNGTNWNMQRGNVDATLLASASRASSNTFSSADQTNYNGRRLLLYLSVSVTTTATVQLALQVKDSISGGYKTIWTAAAAVATVVDAVYNFEAGAAAASFTESVSISLSARTWRLQAIVGGTGSATFSVSGVVCMN